MKTRQQLADLIGYHHGMAQEEIQDWLDDRETTNLLLHESERILQAHPKRDEVVIAMANAANAREAGYLRRARRQRRLGNRYLKQALARDQFISDNSDLPEDELVTWDPKLFATPPVLVDGKDGPYPGPEEKSNEPSYNDKMLANLRAKLTDQPLPYPGDLPEYRTTEEREADQEWDIDRNRAVLRDDTDREWSARV